jgi:hypothetical protein
MSNSKSQPTAALATKEVKPNSEKRMAVPNERKAKRQKTDKHSSHLLGMDRDTAHVLMSFLGVRSTNMMLNRVAKALSGNWTRAIGYQELHGSLHSPHFKAAFTRPRLFRALSIEDAVARLQRAARLEPWMNLMWTNICANKTDVLYYVVAWLGRAARGQETGATLVLQGGGGSGKSLFVSKLRIISEGAMNHLMMKPPQFIAPLLDKHSTQLRVIDGGDPSFLSGRGLNIIVTTNDYASAPGIASIAPHFVVEGKGARAPFDYHAVAAVDLEDVAWFLGQLSLSQ